MFTHTTLKFEDKGIVHEVDFKENQDKLEQILRANYNNEVVKVQVKVREQVYNLTNLNLYF